MQQFIVTGLLWFSAIGCGLLGGIYFAFSAFVMTALGRIDQAAGVAAMNAINVVILKSTFMPMFVGTTMACVALVIFAAFRWGEPGSALILVGGILYVTGMFVVTMVFNVPLNNGLAAIDPSNHGATALWARFLETWTLWNHVRTVACTVASALFIAAIAVR